MGKLFRFGIFLLLSPLLYTFCKEALSELSKGWDSESLEFAIFGFVSYIFILLIIKRFQGVLWDNIEFVRVLRHEMTHAVAALMVGSRVDMMVAANPTNRFGEVGKVERSPTIIGPFITLAPYCLPMLTIPLVLFRSIALDSYQKLIDFFIGFTLAFHYISIILDLRSAPQEDIIRTGSFFSYGFIIVTNLLFLIFLKAIFNDNLTIINDYFKNSISNSGSNYDYALEKITQIFEYGKQLLSEFNRPTPR